MLLLCLAACVCLHCARECFSNQSTSNRRVDRARSHQQLSDHHHEQNCHYPRHLLGSEQRLRLNELPSLARDVIVTVPRVHVGDETAGTAPRFEQSEEFHVGDGCAGIDAEIDYEFAEEVS